MLASMHHTAKDARQTAASSKGTSVARATQTSVLNMQGIISKIISSQVIIVPSLFTSRVLCSAL